MRNLKKILALVLALVMSLSLMATASAAETTSASADPYLQAEEVLKGLLVYQGSSTGYRFEDNITRAETAALVYRVATGDVLNEQAGIYTNHPFTDLSESQKVWANGYISYCYNAEIIKGTGAGKFSPSSNVTGHQILAMVLRAMGYGKNHEFEGKGWEIQTAATARSVGLLNGVTAADDARLGQPATRGLVSQIIFNALMNDKVHFQSNTPYNYVSDGITLGQEQFGLEEITGVIRSNEWANLDGNSVEDEGVTKMKVSAVSPSNTHTVAKVDDTLTLDVSTTLEDVGLREKAYMHGQTGNKSVITTLSSEGLNVIADNEGEGVNTPTKPNEKYDTIKKLADTQGISLTDALYYINYEEAKSVVIGYKSDWIIRYAIAEESVNAHAEWKAYFDAKIAANDVNVSTRNINQTYTDTDGTLQQTTVKCYVLRIQPGTEILLDSVDWEIITEIFRTADRVGDNTIDATGALRDYVIGEVYAGTSSMEDRSDKMSQPQFVEQFLPENVYSDTYNKCEKGDTLRIINNKVDPTLVLRVDHVQTKAVDVYKDELAFNGETDVTKLNVVNSEYPGLRMADYTGKNLYNPDGLSKDDLGVIVNYTIIDGKLSIAKAPVMTEVIKSKSYKDWTVTTEETDTVLGQSGIVNCTRMDENNQMMDEKVLYNIYLDTYNNVRSYELANGPAYLLLTEMYPTNNQNWTYVQDNRQVAEYKIQDAEVDEKLVVKNSNNPFFSDYVWTSRTIGQNIQGTLYNYLQPATAHLDIGADYLPGGTAGTWLGTNYPAVGTYTNYFNVKGAVTGLALRYSSMVGGVLTVNNAWNRNVYALTPNTANAAEGALPGVFLWGATKTYNYTDAAGAAQTTTERDYSFTNVAKYVMQDDELVLSSASKVYQDVNGLNHYRAKVKNLYSGGATDDGCQYLNKTYAGWKSWYEQKSGASVNDLAFRAWFDSKILAGELYLIYESDYVQLTGSHNGDYTHFTVATEYGNKYRALDNQYVNTIDSTEFYVVTPDGTYWKQGFRNFDLAYDTDNVRAAYAVAKNTARDSDGQDYWVADVVVIEVDGLLKTYDSVALMYYNPYETSNSTQYVNSLENAWRTLNEADPDLEIVPKNYSTWQNHSWGNTEYGFYEIYDQNLVSEGTLEAGSITKINQGRYNAHGIYAGIAYRENELVTNGDYIDVRLPGISGTGANYSERVFVRGTNSDGTTWSVPVYRLERDTFGRTTAKEVSLTDWDVTNNADTGDRVIVVYEGASYTSSKAAFIVTLGTEATNARSTGWYNPSWLVRVYNEIVDEQKLWTYGNTVDAANTLLNRATGTDAQKGIVTFEEVKTMLNRVRNFIDELPSTDSRQAALATLQTNLKALLNSAETALTDQMKAQNAVLAVYNDLEAWAKKELAKYPEAVQKAMTAGDPSALDDELATAKAAILTAAGTDITNGDVDGAETAATTTANTQKGSLIDVFDAAESANAMVSDDPAVTFEYAGDDPTDPADQVFVATVSEGKSVAANPFSTELQVPAGRIPDWQGDPNTVIADVGFTKGSVKATDTWTMTVTLTSDAYKAVRANDGKLPNDLVIEDIVLLAAGALDPDVPTAIPGSGVTIDSENAEVTNNGTEKVTTTPATVAANATVTGDGAITKDISLPEGVTPDPVASTEASKAVNPNIESVSFAQKGLAAVTWTMTITLTAEAKADESIVSGGKTVVAVDFKIVVTDGEPETPPVSDTEITEAAVTISTAAITAGTALPTPTVTTTPANGADVSVSWTKGGTAVADPSTTTAGTYVGTITVTPKSGFVAADGIVYKLNGTAVADASELTVNITVNDAGDTEITEADVTIATAAINAGAALPTATVTTTPADGADVSVSWTKDGSPVADTSTTTAGTYVGTITVTPKSGFVAASGIVYKLNGTAVSGAADLTVNITVNAAGDTEITEADVTIATAAITAGDALPTASVSTTPANGADVSVSWTKDGSAVADTSTTTAGTYVGTITVTPKSGFVAASGITYKLNGNAVANAAALTVTITVNAADTEITEADVTITTTGISAGTALPTASVSTTPADGADVSVSWTKDGSAVTDTSTTTAGDYVGTITVTPKSGFVAASGITYKLNGTAVGSAADLTVTITVS